MTPVAGYLYVSADKVFAAQLDYLQAGIFKTVKQLDHVVIVGTLLRPRIQLS